MLKTFMKQYPALRPLTLVLKYFLHQRQLNETFTGGVGSFLLQMMIVSMLQARQARNESFSSSQNLSKKNSAKSPKNRPHIRFDESREEGGPPSELLSFMNNNLGLLLLEFLEMFGSTFNYERCGVHVADGGMFFRKEDMDMMYFNRTYLLALVNPHDPSHDIGKNSYNMQRIRGAFENTQQHLLAAIHRFSFEASSSVGSSQSAHMAAPQLLRLVINVDEVLQVRTMPETRYSMSAAASAEVTQIGAQSQSTVVSNGKVESGSGSDSDVIDLVSPKVAAASC
jgi:DNA polymerase sigma